MNIDARIHQRDERQRTVLSTLSEGLLAVLLVLLLPFVFLLLIGPFVLAGHAIAALTGLF